MAGAPLLDPTCDTTPGNNSAGSDDADGLPADGCDTAAGAGLRYTVTATSTGSIPAHDLTVVDTLPPEITPLLSPGGALATTTGQTITGFTLSTGLWDQTARTITWTAVGPVAPATSLTFDYDAQITVSDELTDGQDLSNTADVDTFYGLSETERDAIVLANPLNDDIPIYGNGPTATRSGATPDTVTVEVHFPSLSIVKTESTGQDFTDVRFDAPFGWDLTVTNPSTVASAFNVDITDTLPEGWTYVPGSALVTTPYATSAIDPACAATPSGACDSAGALNVETLTWTDLVSGLAQPLLPLATITITFDAIPQSAALASSPAVAAAHTGYDGGAGFEHLNTTAVTGEDATGSDSCCDPDGPGGADPVEYGDTDDDGVFIRQIDLEVEKTIIPLDDDTDPADGPYWFGSLVDYVITVDNEGPDDATTVTLSDIFDPTELEFDSVVSSDRGTYDSGLDIWTVGPIADGEILELVLRMRLISLGAVDNIAQVDTADQFDIDSTPGNDEPTEDDQDDVLIETAPTSLGDFVWLDLNDDGVQDVGEPGIADVTVVVTWLDPGDGSPMSFTTTTNAMGAYGVPPEEGLPADTDITVTIDVGMSPNLAGLTQSFDRDLTLDDTSTEQITLADTALPDTSLADLDFDFGYTPGTQSLGDIVWWDQNASDDDTNGVGEEGIEDVDVTATWAGFDDTFGNGDDLVFTTTTDPDGLYLFEDIPAGEYRVVVDDTTLPEGLTTATYDLDGIATEHVAELTIDPGENQLDVDFSYGGPGVLGDTVWIDTNADGVIDPGEPGIGGVTVTATWDGPDETPGTLDDIALTTTTDADGMYLFTGLPFGEYEVVVTDTDLPADITQTYDFDGLGTPHTSVTTLSLGAPSDLDQDFGYRGLGEIGDTVWLDYSGNGGPLVDGNDVGIPGVAVTLTLTNPNGGPDIVFTTTTDADGEYEFLFLPDGDYRVDLDSSTMPGGIGPVFDPDGGDDLESSLTLDDDPFTLPVESIDRDQDFSFAGSGSIGDTVWHDLDADGVIDPGEPGIAGVTVTITYTDPITGLTFTDTRVTDADGVYLFDNLPAGGYIVAVDPATIPVGFGQTFDLDGDLDHTTTLTLGIDEDREDADFGYQEAADLLIDKSHVGDFVIGSDNVWTISVTNDGPAVGRAPVTVTDTLPAGISFSSSVGADWTCSAAGQAVTCTYVDSGGTPIDLLSGATSSFDLVVGVDDAAAPSVINTATVTSETPGDPPENNTDDDPTEVPLSLLDLEKVLSGQLRAGGEATYVISVTNTGPSDTRGDVIITDTLPAGLTFALAEPSSGVSCSASGQIVTCSTSSVIVVDAAITVTLIVDVAEDIVGETIINEAVVEGGNEVNGIPLPPEILDELHADDPADRDDEVAAQVQEPGLPVTGARSITTVIAALAAILFGAVLLWVARRPRRPAHARSSLG